MNELDKAALLERAKRDYSVGVRFISPFSLKEYVSDGDLRYNEAEQGGYWVIATQGGFGYHVCDNGQWAEILTEEPVYLPKDEIQLSESLYMDMSESEDSTAVKIRLVHKGEDFEWFGDQKELIEILKGSELSRLQSENKELKEYKEKVQAVIEKWSDMEINMLAFKESEEHYNSDINYSKGFKKAINQFKLND